MKKTLFMLAVGVLCLAACKMEPDIGDPHVPLKNPFVGVWQEGTAGQYWQFKVDGTGGKADTADGTFPDSFSFFVYVGYPISYPALLQADPSLVLLDDSGNVTCYEFSISGNTATLTPPSGGAITLHRKSGKPQELNLANLLVGEWSADWNGTHNTGGSIIWSIKYREDGTVKTFHHGMHQYENSYALRNNKLVILGGWRFSVAPIIAEVTSYENNKWQVNEEETQTTIDSANWTYTKVVRATWRNE